MSKDGRTYEVIAWNLVTRALFTTLKSQGIIQTSFDTVRKSADKTRAVVCYRGTRPLLLVTTPGLSLFRGTLQEVQAYLNADTSKWTSKPVVAQPVLATAATLGTGEAPETKPAPMLKYVAWGTAAAAAMAGGAAYLLGAF
jgi:hypothetical protein